jgi:hypothetical protein
MLQLQADHAVVRGQSHQAQCLTHPQGDPVVVTTRIVVAEQTSSATRS